MAGFRVSGMATRKSVLRVRMMDVGRCAPITGNRRILRRYLRFDPFGFALQQRKIPVFTLL
jgi:hypothetical protein